MRFRQFWPTIAAAALAAVPVWAQQANAQPAANAQPVLAAGMTIPAQLRTRLDSKKSKAGDPVSAVTTAEIRQQGRTVLPKGSRLLGHVTMVTPAANDREAADLGVLFDQAVLPGGETVLLRADIRSVATPAAVLDTSPEMSPSAAGEGAMGSPAGGGMAQPGGAGRANPEAAPGMPPGGAPPAAAPGATPTAGMRASNGVALHLVESSEPSETGSLLASNGGNLRLDSGTRVQLQELPAGNQVP